MKDFAEQKLNLAKSKIVSELKQLDIEGVFLVFMGLMTMLAFLCGAVLIVVLTIQVLIGMVFSS